MKNSIVKSIFIVILILAASPAFSQNRETRDVEEFSGIALGIHAELYFSQGSPRQVVIEASEDQMADIKTEVRNGVLRIRSNSLRARFRDVKIRVTVPELQSLSMSGSGKMIAETPVKSDQLSLSVSGSGVISIDELSGEKVDASISGSGDVCLGGNDDGIKIRISGSGSIKDEGLKVRE